MSASGLNDIKYKASSGQINLDEAQGIVECFVAGIGNKDSVGDVCASGAFTKSLMRRKPRVVWGHNWNDPIGKVLEIYEVPPSDPRLPAKMRAAGIGGLYARVQFNLNSEKGREAFSNVAFFGEDQEWSIGYKTLRAQFDQGSQANILYEVELYEVSPVLHGANQLTGTISIKADETAMSPSPTQVPTNSSTDSNIHKKLETELSARLGTAVKVANVADGVVHFERVDTNGKSTLYKCRFSYGNDGVFMFGRPEMISPPAQTEPGTVPMVKPVEMPTGMPSGMPTGMPSGMPMAQRRPQQGVPTPPGQTIVVPSTLPGATPASPPLVRVNYQQQSPAPVSQPKLVPEERDLAEALVTIATRYGKFNEDATGIYADYTPAAENEVAKIGVTCANCVLYAGGGKCKVIAQDVEPGGKCRFAVIPDGVVAMNPIGKMKHDAEAEVNEISWIEDIEAKYPAEFVNGKLRNAVKKRHAYRQASKSLLPISEFNESNDIEFSDFGSKSIGYVIPVDVDEAFEVKQAIDPIIDYYMVDSYVEDGGIIITNGVTKDFVDAVSAALKGLGSYPFFQSEKAAGRSLGQSIGAAGNLAGRVSHAAAVFNPNAWDGDNDGLVQEGTPFERPAIPGVNDFGTHGNVDPKRALEAFVNGQGGEISATGQVLPSRRNAERLSPRPYVPGSNPEMDNALGGERNRFKPIGSDINGPALEKFAKDYEKYQKRGGKLTYSEWMDKYNADWIPFGKYSSRDVLIPQKNNERNGRRLSSGGMREGVAESELFSGSKWIDQLHNENVEMDVIPAVDVYGDGEKGKYAVVGRYRTEDGGEEWLYGADDEIFNSVEDAMDFINNYDRQIAEDVYPDDPKFQSLDRARTTGKTRTTGLRLSSGKEKEKPSDSQLWQEGMLGDSLDDLAKKYGMTRQEVRQAQMRFTKDNRDKPEFDILENDLVVHREYMAYMAKLGIYPPGNPDYYTGSEEEKLARATEAASQVGLTVEEASSGGDPSFWDRMTFNGSRIFGDNKRGLSSGAEGESQQEMNDRRIFERRIARGESLDEVANALGIGRDEVRQAESRHAKRLRDDAARMSSVEETPSQIRDREIFDRRATTGIGLDELANELGMSRSEVRQAESRHASRLRNEPPSPRDDRKNRLSSGRQAIDEGLQPESNAVVNKTENVEATDTGDVKVTSLSSGSEPPYTKGAAINGQMYKKMPPRSNYDYSQDGKIIPTEEQQMAIDAVMTGDDVVVSALAGTGKTSTLIAIAKRMEREQPDKKLVYIVFNKSAASDAERRLAGLKNIEVRTQDSMSWRWAFDRPNGKRQVSRLNFNSKDTPAWLKKNTADELVRGFKIKAIKDGDKEFDAEKIALLARNAVDEFEKSGDKTIGFQHFINADDELIRKEDLPSNILSVANAIWDDRNSDTGKFAISNNTLTKQMQLSEMDFASGSWYRSQGKPGLVMYDEAQDFNPVWTAISKAQNNVQQVFVGDSNQAIYGFRGAKNEMDSMAERADYVLPLTEVFRFNQEIAGPGNRVLSVLGNKTNRMIGRGNPKGKLVEPGSMENPTLILNRTNRGVISECIDALEKGKKVATTQNAMNELTQIINSFSRLYGRESRGGMEHKALEEFQNIDELKKAIAEGTATKKAESLYKLFSSTGFETLNRVKRDVKVAKLDGGDKVSDAEIIASAKAKIAKRPNDFLSSVVSQFEKRGSLSPKQWAALEKNTGLSRAGEEHDVLIMTGHLAKGLESPRVKMGGDWWGPQKKKLEDGTEVVEWPDEQHMNGVYVAMTRATEELDIGSADWIYDWSSDEDALPNTSRGLSSGRSKRTQGKLAKRRPWSEEERQAFADGQRERAQTIPGKRREGPSASEFGSRAARNERRLSSGYSGGAVVGDSEENRLKNERVDNPINMRRRSAMGTSGGIGQFSGKSQTKKKSTPFAGGDVNPEFSKALEAATGTSGRWTPQTGTLDTNRQFDGKTPWMVPAAKLRELFKDENGKQLSDDEILRSLGFSSRNADTLGKEIIDAMDNPRGGISENDAQSLLQALNPDKEDAIQDEMRKIWGFDAAPGWTRRDSTSPITREEFDSLSEKERAKLIPDFGDFINYEPVSVAKPQPKAQTEPARKAGESSRLSLKEVVARSTDSAPTYSADVLAKHLGLIKDDEKIANAATAARVAGDFKKYGITVNPDTLRKWSHDGVPTEALAFLQDTGKISSVSEIYGSRYAAFDELPSKNVVKRKVFDTLKENGMSDEQAIAAMKRVFKAGTVHDELIKAEEKRAKQAAGEIPFTPTGSAQKYDRAELEGFAKSIADEIEKAKKKSGQQGERPEIDVDKTFGIKKIEDIAEPVARESKPNTVNPVKEAPAVVKSESLDKAAIRKLTDEEIKNAIEELLVVANPVVIKNKKTEELEFPDGIRPSDERSVRARRITTLLENEADRRSMTKSAWIGASIRTKGARSQRYKVIDSIDTK